MKAQLMLVLAIAVQFANAEESRGPGENLAAGKPYTFDPSPTYEHCTDPGDAKQLTDGEYSKGYFWTQKTTVGWQGASAVTIRLDLGAVQPIRGASFNTAAGRAGVTWPIGISVLVSDDGDTFHLAGELVGLDAKHGPPPAAEEYAVHRYWTDELRTHGRYVLFMVDASGPFVFADEVEVYRGEPGWVREPLVGEGVRDAQGYRQQLAVVRRLRADLRAVRAADAAHALNGELDAIEAELPKLEWHPPADFRAVLPLNELHARIFRAQAAVWRAQGAAPLTVWAAQPWDPLSLTQRPPAEAAGGVNVALMQGEYRAAAFNIANAGEAPLMLRMRISGLAGGENPNWINVHEVAWTDTKSGQPVAAALPEAKRDGGDLAIDVPAGLTRQVWLTLHPGAVPQGEHHGEIVLKGGGLERRLPLTVRVSPLRFPACPALHVGGWDYTDTESRYEITQGNRDRVIAHLRDHFVDSPWATAAVLPADRSVTNFNRWVARWPGARQYCVFASVGANFDGEAMGTPGFDKKVGEWIRFWAGHAERRGIRAENLLVLLVDEPHEAQQDGVILAWAKALRAVGTGVKIWEDPTHRDPATANPEMMAACDVLCPNRPMFLAGGPAFRDYYAQRRASGAELAFYSCSGPVRLLDPYSYHRLQAWSCWQQGARSSFFWAFGDSGGGSSWNEYAQERAASYTPLFLDATTVTAGKHMEAIRESVEDFEYPVMLRDRLAAAQKAGQGGAVVEQARRLLAGAAARVLDAPGAGDLQWAQPKDRGVADAVRVEILEALEALGR